MKTDIRTRTTSRLAVSVLLAAGLGLGPAWAADAPVRGGELSATLDLEIASLDPLYGSAVGHDRTILNLFYENLYNLDADGNFVPRLAESWQIADDRLSLTLHLREGIEFSDGTRFNADAVKANIDRLVEQRGTSRFTSLASAIAGADVIDDTTVRINFERQSGSVLSILASEAGMMVSPKALADPEALRRNPVGTGPFLFDEWQGGFRLKATRNPGYWRTGADGEPLPYLDSATFRFINDTSVAIVEAQSGNVHIIDKVQVKDFERIENDPAMHLNPRRTQISQFLVFNNSGEPFASNQKLRQAIALAINPAQVEKVVSKGFGEVTPTWVPPTSWEYTADLPVPAYDPELAADLYEESGVKGPFTLSIIQRDPDTQISQLVQAQLAQAGIPLTIEVLEREAWLEKTRGRNHEIAMLRSTAPLSDPDMRFSGYYLPESSGNYSAITDEKVIDMVRAAEAETDQAERKKIYADIQRAILENTYEVYLFSRPAAEVLRNEVKNFDVELVGSWLLDEVWLEQ